MLQQWLEDRCTPVVATLVTEDADYTCRKNGLNFEQLVSAFCRLDGLKVPFRSAGHQYSLDSFALRFVRGSSMRPLLAREADPALSNIAVSAAVDAARVAEESSATGRDVEQRAAGALLESCIEDQDWYNRYRVKLWEGICHQEHEMLDCPAAVLVVVSSTEASGDPVACFDELSSPRYLPPPFQSRQYDPESPALVYVLLHDWCRGAAQGVDPDSVLSQMRGTFTAGQCRMLCVNSLPPESPNMSQPDIWADVCHEDSPISWSGRSASRSAGGGGDGGDGGVNNVRGRCLSPEDLLATREFVRGLASQVVVPSMERRILSLNATVSSVRKGVRNVLKSWWRKPREGVDPMGADGGGGVGGATYRFDRIESQIRLLADSAFVMRDFETAASMYRMARDDFKSDRALLHYAAASEMLAVSLYLLSGRTAAAFSQQSPSSFGAANNSPGGSYAALQQSPPSGTGVRSTPGAIGTSTIAGAIDGVGGGSVDLSAWEGGGSLGGVGVIPALRSTGSFTAGGGGIGVTTSAPNSGGGVGSSTSSSAFLGRGREADTAFALALDAYQRRAAEEAGPSGVGYHRAGGGGGGDGGGGGGAGGGARAPPIARLAARAALLYADVAAAAASTDDRFSATGGVMTPRSAADGRGGGADGAELQAEAEEALLHASMHETPLCAAVLLEVSANRCRAAGRLRRASFRLVQAGHMYKNFGSELARLRREREQHGESAQGFADEDKQAVLGMHAARCFLGALSGYQGSGWLAAEEYACAVLPKELEALHRPVAALQLYIRLLAARGRTGTDAVSAAVGVLGQAQLQQQQRKRASREMSLMRAFGELCRRYPQAAHIAAL